MRQLVQDLRSGDVEVVDLPEPEVRSGHVRVSTEWSVISAGTEQAVSSTAARSLVGKALDRPEQVRKVAEKAMRDGPSSALAAVRARLDDLLTPGYSSSGVVDLVGTGVEGIRPGDRVGCFGANHACHAETIVVPAPLCLHLPDDLDDRWGAFGALGGVAAHGVRVARVEAGSIVAVIGLGLVGQIAAQLVTAAGGRVVGIDPARERVMLARRLGAVAGSVLGEVDVEEAVAAASKGIGADAVIVTAASSDSSPVELAARVARDRATVSVVGDVGLHVPRAPFFEKELELRVSRSYGPGRYDPAYEERGQDYPPGYVRWTERRLIAYFFEEVAAGRVRLEELVSHSFPIEHGADAYKALSEPARLAIMLSYSKGPREPRRQVPTGAPAPTDGTGALRIGLIGPGLFARGTLLPLLEKLNVPIVGVASGSSARALGVARSFGATYAAGDAEELLSDDSIGAVVIATRHDSHADLAARALERGKGVFVEKPLAIDERGLERLRPLLAAGGRLVADFNRAFAPNTREVQAVLRDRLDPVYIHYRINAGYLDPGHWVRDPEQGGRLVGEACHFVDLCSQLVGTRLLSIQTTSLGVAARTLHGDNFVLTLRYQDGSVATVAYVSTGHSGLRKERMEVMGAGRAAVIEDFRRVRLHSGPRSRRRRRPPGLQDKGHEALLLEAVNFLRHGGTPPVPYQRLLETTEATLIARDALRRQELGFVSLSGG